MSTSAESKKLNHNPYRPSSHSSINTQMDPKYNNYQTVPNSSTAPTGIVRPQQITTFLPTNNAQTNTPGTIVSPIQTTNEKVKKLTEEKKKSDAYDFPINLVSSTVKKGHAKPVGVFTNQFSRNGSTPTTPKINPHSRNSSVNPAQIIPKNPYASIQQPNPVIAPTTNMINNPINMMPTARMRGNSAVSTTSGKSVGTSVATKQNPYSPQITKSPRASISQPAGIPNNSKYGPISPSTSQFNSLGQVLDSGLVHSSTTPMGSTLSPISTKLNANNLPSPQSKQYPGNSSYLPSQNDSRSKYAPAFSTGQYAGYSSHSKPAVNQPALPFPRKQSESAGDANPPINTVLPPGIRKTNVLLESQQNLRQNANYATYAEHSHEQTNSYNVHGASNKKIVNNNALLVKQFPIFNWGSNNKVIYGIPLGQNDSVMMPTNSPLQNLRMIGAEILIKPTQLIKSFPGPLCGSKVKKSDVEQWLLTASKDADVDEEAALLLSLLKLKLSTTSTFKDMATLLYDTATLHEYLAHPLTSLNQAPNAFSLDPESQFRVLSFLQVGAHDDALRFSLEKKDYSISLLIGSLLGKDKWCEVVQRYLSEQFTAIANNSNLWAHLLPLIFQVFVGSSKTAVSRFYKNQEEANWAAENWRGIVAAVLINITDHSQPKQTASIQTPPAVVTEFLIEFGIFLKKLGMNLPASILFVIANVPLSNVPILPDSDVHFRSIGSTNNVLGAILSETYEYTISQDLKFKGYPATLPLKLFHAYCLQEEGLTSLAYKYVDYLSSATKSMTKKDAESLNLSHHLSILTNRLAGSSSSWLGKPKLSSVWGQIDKSFNKYIGGDDDLPKPATEKKVFDSYTPSSSTNSSMIDLSHSVSNFMPAQINQLSRNNLNSENKMSTVPDLTAFGEKNAFEPPTNTWTGMSLQGSPQRAVSNMKPPLSNRPNLRRIKTELSSGEDELLSMTVKQGKKSYAPDNLNRASNSSNETLKSGQSANNSVPYHQSTPNLIGMQSVEQKKSYYPSNQRAMRKSAMPTQPENLEISRNARSYEPHTKTKKVYKPNQTLEEEPPIQSYNDDVVSQNQFEEAPNLQNDQEKILQPTASPEGLSQTRISNYSPERPPLPVYSEDSKNMDPKNISDLVKEQQITDKSLEHELEQLPTENDADYKISNANEDNAINEEEREIGNGEVELNVDQSQSHLSASIPQTQNDRESTTVSISPGLGLEMDVDKEDSNAPAPKLFSEKPNPSPYAPPTVGKKGTKKTSYMPKGKTESFIAEPEISSYESSPLDMYAYSGYRPQEKEKSTSSIVEESSQISNEDAPDKSSIAARQAVELKQDEVSKKPITTKLSTPKSLPIPPSPFANPLANNNTTGVLPTENFEPVIKVSRNTNARAFTPVPPASDQYDDVVEEDSDDSDDSEDDSPMQSNNSNNGNSERNENKQNDNYSDDEMPTKKKSHDNNDAGSGWFGWLKKDTNEKKAVKAKLGNQNSFYYDEQLKRWVNKNASEEDKQQLATPAPPPPIVKRKDTEPKTKPRSISGVTPHLDTGIGSSIPPISGNAPPKPKSGPSLAAKTNGLDDLLNLTAAAPATSTRRKKKGGRGYVNVMENL